MRFGIGEKPLGKMCVQSNIDNRISRSVGEDAFMAVYGIIMEWDEHTTQTGEHVGRGEFYFASPDAKDYIEVEHLRQFYEVDRTEELKTYLAGERRGDNRIMIPMRFVRRFFAQQETIPECRVIFDCRVWPDVTKEEFETTGGLPEGTKYMGLGKKAQAKA